ncbi:MAG: chromosomal replication initiator protein DnaA [Phycisphaerales bacterium]|nr:chromosomal replication initiator protein DnaA [Phycisphaerales bacterium]
MTTMGIQDRQFDRGVLEDVLGQIRSLHPQHARKWFEELEPLGIVSGAFGIRAQSDMHRDYLRRVCLEAFNDSLRDVTGQLLAVRFLGPQDLWESPIVTAKKDLKDTLLAKSTVRVPAVSGSKSTIWADEVGVSAQELNQSQHGMPIIHAKSERSRLSTGGALPIDPDYGFDNFVIGPNNRLAQAASIAVSENPGYAYNPLFIHGGVGLGKTHLLQAICLKILQDNPDINLHYVSCDGFMTQFMSAVQSGRMAEFRHSFRDVDLLVVDDIHCLAKRDRTQEEFFHTFNALYQANKQIILSSDAPPEEIPDLEERLVSRFMWGLVAKIEKPGFETRVEIIKRKADARGISLPEPVITEIAHYIDTNIRELEGNITKLQLYASVEDREIDLDLAREALGEEFAAAVSAQNTKPTIDRIITEITNFYSVKRIDILGKRRHKSIALPRQVGMYLSRKYTRHSLEEVGAHFGGRDHTTVMHAVKTVTNRSKTDESLHSDVLSIESRLRVDSNS